MNLTGFLIILFAFTTGLLVIQRAEARRRLFVALIMVVVFELTRRYAVYRDYNVEAVVAAVLAVVLNGLFFFVIGRYNPPADSDEMKVLGMDD